MGPARARLQIEVSLIIIHKTDQPDVVVNFFNADRLAGKDLAEVDLFIAPTDAAAAGNDDDLVGKGIVDIGQARINARRRLLDLGRALHVQSFVRGLVVEDFDEVIAAGLLLKEVAGGRLGGFFL
jgi:hypothetical protein